MSAPTSPTKTYSSSKASLFPLPAKIDNSVRSPTKVCLALFGVCLRCVFLMRYLCSQAKAVDLSSEESEDEEKHSTRRKYTRAETVVAASSSVKVPFPSDFSLSLVALSG